MVTQVVVMLVVYLNLLQLIYTFFFKEKYKLVAIDLNKQQALDSDPKAIQKI